MVLYMIGAFVLAVVGIVVDLKMISAKRRHKQQRK